MSAVQCAYYTWLQFPSCMNLFVLSGLLTNIPIGFFFCFHAVMWHERVSSLEWLSVRERAVLLSPFAVWIFSFTVCGQALGKRWRLAHFSSFSRSLSVNAFVLLLYVILLFLVVVVVIVARELGIF